MSSNCPTAVKKFVTGNSPPSQILITKTFVKRATSTHKISLAWSKRSSFNESQIRDLSAIIGNSKNVSKGKEKAKKKNHWHCNRRGNTKAKPCHRRKQKKHKEGHR